MVTLNNILPFSSPFQHIVSVLPCSGGLTVPLHLAAHLHPRAPPLHAGHRVHPYSLHCGASVQLAAQAQGSANRRGEAFSFGSSLFIIAMCALCSRGLHMTWDASCVSFFIYFFLSFPQVLVVDLCNSRFLRQVGC